jgi:hypothetical protein
MRKIVLEFALAASSVLLVSGTASAADSPMHRTDAVAPRTVPTGQVNRYILPHYYSAISGGGRSFTAVSIRNNSGSMCSAAVRFQNGMSTSDICVVNQSIPAGQSRTYCSRRPGGFGAYDCTVACSPGLTFDAGQAFVTSTNSTTCANIAVDAEVIYTTSFGDNVITGLTNLSVVKFGNANLGD